MKHTEYELANYRANVSIYATYLAVRAGPRGTPEQLAAIRAKLAAAKASR